MKNSPSIVALSGGVGGAKFAEGLYQALPSGSLTVCVNTGDDFTAFGLSISPDLDTVCYALAAMANPETGWGQSGESWTVLNAIRNLGGPDWFQLGDKDLATHLERTRLLEGGSTLSEITRQFCEKWHVRAGIFPMSDSPVRTMVQTKEFGEIPFQEYFVQRKCEPQVTGFSFLGIEKAAPSEELLSSLERADFILIGPSNPLVSIDPILCIPQVRERIAKKKVIAISPIVGGKALKGPLAKMYAELGMDPSPLSVAQHYRNIVDGFVIDVQDRRFSKELAHWDIITLVTDTVMKAGQDRKRLAEDVLDFAKREFLG